MRVLAELLDTDGQLSHQDFIERLARSFDLADSIRISTVHEAVFEPTDAQPVVSRGTIRDEFQRERAAIVGSAAQSFSPQASANRTRFPRARAEMTVDEIMDAAPYLSFYSAQQRIIDFRIRDLHARTRDALADLSPPLARLAALDTVLAGPLAGPARRAFAAIPRLLGQRFASLRDQHRRTATDPSRIRERWEVTLLQLRSEMRSLLLAEIETRLLPTQGLVDALDELEEHDDY